MHQGPLKVGGVPEHFNLPWHLALDQVAESTDGLAGMSVEWEDQPGGTGEMLAKLEAGELDLVSILTEGTVAAINRGLPVTIIQVYVASPLQWGVFVPADSDITAEDQLDGARIAISRFNSGSHLMAFIQAERNGWKLADEQFVVVGGLDGAVGAFNRGEAELFLWDQYMTKPLVDNGTFRQVAVQETPWPSFVIAARNEILTGRTSEVGRLVDAVIGQAAALHGRPGVVALIADRYGLDHVTVEAWLAATSFQPRSAMDPAIGPRVLEALALAGFS